jgi:hypothetical protein
MRDYKLIKAETYNNLETRVSTALRQGFIPHGSLTIIQEMGKTIFIQPVVK